MPKNEVCEALYVFLLAKTMKCVQRFKPAQSFDELVQQVGTVCYLGFTLDIRLTC
jgi:hypothetical protein